MKKEVLKTLVFDLDGTLYQNLEFHRPYMRMLLEGSHYEKMDEEIIGLVDEILNGGFLRMNLFYDLRGLPMVSTMDQLREVLFDAIRPDLELERIYEQGSSVYLNAGDAYSVVRMVATGLHIPKRKQNECYFRIRKVVEEAMSPDPELAQILSLLRMKYQVILATNSPKETSDQVLSTLGMLDSFDAVLYNADKPFGLKMHLNESFAGILKNPESVLSIGDYRFNEIDNFELWGTQTMWVCPYKYATKEVYDPYLKDMEDVKDFLRRLG